jgi:glycosyltransferase involved in cell wall biosynthesis
MPTVSIGLPVYNGEKYLGCAIDSILAQDFPDFELIISDNASQDRTAAICREYAQHDKRIRYCRLDSNCGAVPNFQRVFWLARGRYFKWAAHDDVCLPGFLRRCVEALKQAPPSVVLVYPRTEKIDGDGKPAGVDGESLESKDARPHRRAAHVLQNVILAWAQFGLIRPEALRKTRLHGSFIASDYVLLAELAMLGEFREIPEVLFQRRVYPGMSNVVHQSRRQWLAWLDPTKQGRKLVCPPVLRVGWECVASVNHLPLPQKERILCHLWLPSAWYLRHLRSLGGRYKRKLLNAMGTNSD